MVNSSATGRSLPQEERKHLIVNDRGSALMLVPAGVLVLIVLAAIAVDSSVLLLGQRELANATAAAANDAATLAIDVDRLRRDDCLEVVDERAYEVAVAAALVQTDAVEVDPSDVIVTVSDLEVRVQMSGTVEHIFAKAIPGSRRTSRVSAASTAELRTAGRPCAD